MNINLVINKDSSPINNYQNVLIENIEQLPNSACENLIINKTFNYLTDKQFQLLMHKIRHNGTITISSLDAMELAFALSQGKIDIKTFSSLTRHTQEQHTLLEIKMFLEQNGYKIETAAINDLTFYIKAKRP